MTQPLTVEQLDKAVNITFNRIKQTSDVETVLLSVLEDNKFKYNIRAELTDGRTIAYGIHPKSVAVLLLPVLMENDIDVVFSTSQSLEIHEAY